MSARAAYGSRTRVLASTARADAGSVDAAGPGEAGRSSVIRQRGEAATRRTSTVVPLACTWPSASSRHWSSTARTLDDDDRMPPYCASTTRVTAARSAPSSGRACAASAGSTPSARSRAEAAAALPPPAVLHVPIVSSARSARRLTSGCTSPAPATHGAGAGRPAAREPATLDDGLGEPVGREWCRPRRRAVGGRGRGRRRAAGQPCYHPGQQAESKHGPAIKRVNGVRTSGHPSSVKGQAGAWKSPASTHSGLTGIAVAPSVHLSLAQTPCLRRLHADGQ